MNTWSLVHAGTLQSFEGGSRAIYRTSVTPAGAIQKSGSQILFKELTSAAEVSVDGATLGERKDPAPGPLTVTLPEAKGNRTISVLVQSPASANAGFSGAGHRYRSAEVALMYPSPVSGR